MLHRTYLGAAVVLLVLTLAACSGSGAASGAADFRTSLGTTVSDVLVEAASEALLTRYPYRYQRRVVTGEDVRLETEWLETDVFADEAQQGYTAIRTRITITARPRDRSQGTISGRMTGETEGQMGNSAVWSPIGVTDMRRAYYRDISNFIEQEIRTVR